MLKVYKITLITKKMEDMFILRPLLKELVPNRLYEWNGKKHHKGRLEISVALPDPIPQPWKFEKGDSNHYMACQMYRIQKDIWNKGVDKEGPVTYAEGDKISEEDELIHRYSYVEAYKSEDIPLSNGLCLVDFVFPNNPEEINVPKYTILIPRHFRDAQTRFIERKLRQFPTTDSSQIQLLNQQFLMDYYLRNDKDDTVIFKE